MKRLIVLISICTLCTTFANSTSAKSNNLQIDGDGIAFALKLVKMPTFPASLISQGYSEGNVKIAMEVDNNGELRDWIVLESSHPDFVTSIGRVITDWRFTPPYIYGENRSVVSYLDVQFKSDKNVISFTHPTEAQNIRINELIGFRSQSARIASINELDSAPYPISQPSPSIPAEVIDKHDGSRAIFSFYVDEAGEVRIPSLTQTDGEPELGMLLAAQDALAQWKFAPPTRKKRPTIVKLSQTFVFKNK